MSEMSKDPGAGEVDLPEGDGPAVAPPKWENVPTPSYPATPILPPPQIIPPPQPPSVLPPTPAVSATGTGGYQEVFGGSNAPGPATTGSYVVQGYGAPIPGQPTSYPPGGYPGQSYPLPPGVSQNNYSSPNVADMLAAGVLLGGQQRQIRRFRRRFIVLPLVLLIVLVVIMARGCAMLFH